MSQWWFISAEEAAEQFNKINTDRRLIEKERDYMEYVKPNMSDRDLLCVIYGALSATTSTPIPMALMDLRETIECHLFLSTRIPEILASAPSREKK